MKNHKAIADFRLNEWPKSQGSYTRYYNKHMSVHDLSRVIDYVGETLFNTKRALVRYPVFTLVNVAFPKSRISYGYMPAPHSSIFEMTDLALTFAFTKKIEYSSDVKPDYSMRVASGTYLWGTSFSNNTDYMTISLPKQISRTMRLGTLSTDLEYLYFLLGPWSKNFVRHNKYYLPDKPYDNDDIDPKIAHSNIFQLNIPDLMNRFPYNEWIFNKEMWQRQPNVLNPKSVDDNFCDFYCQYLGKKFFGKYKSKNVLAIEDKVIDYLESAVLDFLSLMKGLSDPSMRFDKQNGLSLVYLITGEYGQTLEDFVLQLLGRGDNGEILMYGLYFSNVRSAIRKLLAGGKVT